MAVGQKGSSGGSGGTFVVKQAADASLIPLVIAGGAGEDYHGNKNRWCHAQLKEFGNGPSDVNNNNLGFSGSGNHDGAGFNTDQPNMHSDDLPKCFQNGMIGGKI